MSIGSTSVLAGRPRSRRFDACVHVGLAAAIACAPATAVLAHSAQTSRTASTSTAGAAPAGRQSDGQRQPTAGRLVVPVTATVAAGDGADAAATGSLAIQRFARTTEDAVAAVGTLTLTFADQATGASRTIVTQAAMPLERPTDVDTTAGDASPRTPASPTTTVPAARACETLRLVLGSIDVAPLGVAVRIERANLDVTALPGLGDRLGSLLCELTTQVAGSSRPAELVNSLNALLDTLG